MKKYPLLKKVLPLLLCLTIMLAFPVVAYARYTYIDSVDSSFTIVNGTAECKGTVYGKTVYPIDVKVELQQKQSNGTWLTIETWTNSATAIRATKTGTYSVPSGYTYRCYVTGTIYGENGYASVEKNY